MSKWANKINVTVGQFPKQCKSYKSCQYTYFGVHGIHGHLLEFTDQLIVWAETTLDDKFIASGTILSLGK